MSKPETLQQMTSFLQEHAIPSEFYSIGGLGSGECIGISHEDGQWQTYFSEKGKKSSICHYADEAAACRGFLKELKALLADYGVTLGF